jgi:phenylalanyl-tRNA synthetase alpha chain
MMAAAVSSPMRSNVISVQSQVALAPMQRSARPCLRTLGRFSSSFSEPQVRPLRAASVEVAAPSAPPRDQIITEDPNNNVTDYIYGKMGINLHHRPDHPIGIIKNAIYSYFEQTAPGLYKNFDDLHPVVSTKANFDEVLVPADHVSRSPNDTYYVSNETVLRCHTSAHQAETLRAKHPAFLVTGEST